jgi:hypothetical protein
MGALLAGLATLVLMLLLARGFIRANPRQLATGFRRSAGFLLAVAAVALVMTGRLSIAILCMGGAWVLLFGTVPPWHRPDFGASTAGGAGGRQRAEPPRQSTMSRSEALRVLGLETGASEADIRAAHRRLIQQTHPDKGGTNYLASKINEAKDVLLSGK